MFIDTRFLVSAIETWRELVDVSYNVLRILISRMFWEERWQPQGIWVELCMLVRRHVMYHIKVASLLKVHVNHFVISDFGLVSLAVYFSLLCSVLRVRPPIAAEIIGYLKVLLYFVKLLGNATIPSAKFCLYMGI
jgi:hypothetical protein